MAIKKLQTLPELTPDDVVAMNSFGSDFVSNLLKQVEIPIIIEAFHIYIPIKKGNGTAVYMSDAIITQIEKLYEQRHQLKFKYIDEQRKIWDDNKNRH